MQGNLVRRAKGFRRCYLHWTSTIEYIDPPTTRPGCNMFDTVISKVVISPVNPAAKYVQLSFPPECRGEEFRRFFYLTLWENGKRDVYVESTWVSRVLIPNDGYVNICTNQNKPQGIICHVLEYSEGRAVSKLTSDDKIALIEPSPTKIIDIFHWERRTEQCDGI